MWCIWLHTKIYCDRIRNHPHKRHPPYLVYLTILYRTLSGNCCFVICINTGQQQPSCHAWESLVIKPPRPTFRWWVPSREAVGTIFKGLGVTRLLLQGGNSTTGPLRWTLKSNASIFNTKRWGSTGLPWRRFTSNRRGFFCSGRYSSGVSHIFNPCGFGQWSLMLVVL